MVYPLTRRALMGSALGAVFVPRGLAGPAISASQFTGAANGAVEWIEREDGFSGVILAARGDRVLLREAAGFVDRRPGP
jgi:hypothetical protein